MARHTHYTPALGHYSRLVAFFVAAVFKTILKDENNIDLLSSSRRCQNAKCELLKPFKFRKATTQEYSSYLMTLMITLMITIILGIQINVQPQIQTSCR